MKQISVFKMSAKAIKYIDVTAFSESFFDVQVLLNTLLFRKIKKFYLIKRLFLLPYALFSQ